MYICIYFKWSYSNLIKVNYKEQFLNREAILLKIQFGLKIEFVYFVIGNDSIEVLILYFFYLKFEK